MDIIIIQTHIKLLGPTLITLFCIKFKIRQSYKDTNMDINKSQNCNLAPN